MKDCLGCRHLVRSLAVCKAVDQDPTVIEEYGVRTARYWRRPSIHDMRAPGALCGPDAVLYEPTIWRRVWRLLSRAER